MKNLGSSNEARKVKIPTSVKIYLDEDFKKFKEFNLTKDLTAEQLIKSLLDYNALLRNFQKPTLERLYLTLIVRSLNEEEPMIKRVIQPFEEILDIITKISESEEEDKSKVKKEYLWLLQMRDDDPHEENYNDNILNNRALDQSIRINEEVKGGEKRGQVARKNSQNGDSYIYKTYRRLLSGFEKENDVPNWSEDCLKKGFLWKRNHKGTFVEKEFRLYKDNLAYRKPKTKVLKVTSISLMDSSVEKKFDIREKFLFEIKTSSRNLQIKAKSQEEMEDWIRLVGLQIDILKENDRVNNVEKDIKNLEYRFQKEMDEKMGKLLTNFTKFMGKHRCRQLLFKFLCNQSDWLQGLEMMVEVIYSLNTERLHVVWLESLENFQAIIFDLSSKDQHERMEESGKEDWARRLWKTIEASGELQLFKKDYEKVKAEFTNELKKRITKNLEEVLKGILSSLEGKFVELIMRDKRFQEELIEIVKRPFYGENNEYDDILICFIHLVEEVFVNTLSRLAESAREQKNNFLEAAYLHSM